MDDSNIVNEVLKELVDMIESKMAGDLQKPEGSEPAPEMPMANHEMPMEGDESTPFQEAEDPAGETDEEKTKRMLMEKFGGK